MYFIFDTSVMKGHIN